MLVAIISKVMVISKNCFNTLQHILDVPLMAVAFILITDTTIIFSMTFLYQITFIFEKKY